MVLANGSDEPAVVVVAAPVAGSTWSVFSTSRLSSRALDGSVLPNVATRARKVRPASVNAYSSNVFVAPAPPEHTPWPTFGPLWKSAGRGGTAFMTIC